MFHIAEQSWPCPNCKLTRFPDEDVVRKDKKLYMIRLCRVCKYQDIEELKYNWFNRKYD